MSKLLGFSARCICLETNAASKRLIRRGVSSVGRKEIESLEDLAKLQSLNDVDPELIKRLINERTSELNTQKELEMLKSFNNEDQLSKGSPLKRFTRPLWIFLLMSSTVYLVGHYLWWRLEYEQSELEQIKRIQSLEDELQSVLKEQRESGNPQPAEMKQNRKPWYKRYFW